MDAAEPLQPSSAEAYARQVGELLDRRRSAQARNLLREALASFPDDADLLLQGARADALEDRNASAIETLQRVVARQPDHFGAQAFLLSLLTEEGELAEAERLATGEMIGAIAMTEPGTGSDLQGVATTAIRDGDHYIMNEIGRAHV